MDTMTFEKQVLDTLSHLEQGMLFMKRELNLIKEKVVDDTILSTDDKQAIDEALIAEKEGRLLTKEQVFR